MAVPSVKPMPNAAVPETGSEALVIERVLVVDDSKVQRKILSASLKRWGFSVSEAASGEEALEFCQANRVDLILSDWMMPGMSGLEFCQAFRALDTDTYGYFILLTSKSEKGDVARGLDVGADDFLSKPVNGGELRARITAGERILRMQQELSETNRLISETLNELQNMSEMIDRDLLEARKLQQSLVRERYRDFGPAQVSLLLRPSGHVGGDLVGYFQIAENRIGVFGLDVSGHGITSALMTARLSGFFPGNSPSQNVALQSLRGGGYTGRPPAEVAERLNQLTLEEMETENYFTLVYADVDLATGEIAMVQAGHPNPALQRANGEIEYPGEGGMPVGLIEGATYQGFDVKLNPGDRLLLFSDGVTECESASGPMLEEEGLIDILQRNQTVRGTKFLEAITWDLTEFAGGLDFQDDVSAALIEFHPAGYDAEKD